MIKHSLHSYFAFILAVIALAGCKKEEENLNKLTVSRLYISISGLDSLANHTLVYDPADISPFSGAFQYLSTQSDTHGISFDDSTGSVYQVSAKKWGIKKFAVSIFGKLTESSSFVDSGLLSPKEIAYRRKDSLLFIANNGDSTIRAFFNPSGSSGNRNEPKKKLKLDGKPWGICLNRDSLFIVLEGDRREVQLSKILRADTSKLSNKTKITINGAVNLHGVFYYAKQDVLLLTDIGQEGSNSDGKIYIIESAKALFASNSSVTPTRIIAGANTFLGNPVDIDFDRRDGKNLIYVAEKLNKRILVFKLSDTGNAAPLNNQELPGTPEAIYLDAR